MRHAGSLFAFNHLRKRSVLEIVLIEFTGGDRVVDPKTQGVDGQCHLVQLVFDLDEIRELVIRDLTVYGDLDEAVLVLVDGVESRDHLQSDLRKFLWNDLRNIFLPDRALMRAEVIAKRRILVRVGHGQDLFRMRKRLFVLDLLDTVCRDILEFF